MARFGQGFIQGLTQPGYMQGLFDLGRAAGAAPGIAREKDRRQSMLQQFMESSPIQQGRLLQNEGVRTGNMDLVLKGQQLENAQLEAGVQQGKDAIKARMLNLPTEQLDTAQADLEAYYKSVGGNVLDVAGYANEIKTNRFNAQYNIAVKKAEMDKLQSNALEDRVLENLLAANRDDVPEETRKNLTEVQFRNVRKRLQEARQADYAFEEAKNGVPLSQHYLDIAERLVATPGYENKYPGLKAALETERNTREQKDNPARARASKDIISYVKAEAKLLQEAERSDDGINIAIDKAVDFFRTRRDLVKTIDLPLLGAFGMTYSDFFNEYDDDSKEMQRFRRQARQALKENPSLRESPKAIIDAGMEGMESLFEDEQLQRQREEIDSAFEGELSIRKIARLQQIMDERGVNAQQAEKIYEEEKNSALARAQALTQRYSYP